MGAKAERGGAMAERCRGQTEPDSDRAELTRGQTGELRMNGGVTASDVSGRPTPAEKTATLRNI